MHLLRLTWSGSRNSVYPGQEASHPRGVVISRILLECCRAWSGRGGAVVRLEKMGVEVQAAPPATVDFLCRLRCMGFNANVSFKKSFQKRV